MRRVGGISRIRVQGGSCEAAFLLKGRAVKAHGVRQRAGTADVDRAWGSVGQLLTRGRNV